MDLLNAAPQQPPAPPPPAAAPVPVAISAAGQTIPLSSADVSALRAKRAELSNQLSSAAGRREDVAEELLKTPPGPGRAGLEQRLAVLDNRIAEMEQEIAVNGRELARAPLSLAKEDAAAPRFGPFSSGQLTAISIVSIVMVWGPLAWAAARMMIKRSNQPKPSPQLLESTARLERIEQAVDAMSIEIERISEGQRFVTQLMSQKAPSPMLVPGADTPT